MLLGIEFRQKYYRLDDCYAYKKISESELIDIMKTFITYIYRRSICDYPTNAPSRIFANLIEKVEQSREVNYVIIIKYQIMSMVTPDIAELILRDHLLWKINQMVSFDFTYDLVAPHYPVNGRSSVTLLLCLKCCWWDTFTASSQNADLSRKFN